MTSHHRHHKHHTLAGRIALHRVPVAKKGFWGRLGPGLITGASDDDPSGIATYSQAGAAFGYGLTWVVVLCFPLMAAMQEICARIGRVTGQGIAGNIRAHYPRPLLLGIVGLLVAANVINIGADLGAMAAAVGLLVGGPVHLYVVGFAVGCVALEVFSRYERYVRILKWTALSLLLYVAVALVVEVPWGVVLLGTVWPHLDLGPEHIVAIVAVLGTTISPYCFFWQASQEAQEERTDATQHPLTEAPAEGPAAIARMRADTLVGMGYACAISLFIMITAAATLNAHGVTDIQTSAQAAEALRPIAGDFAYLAFAIGIIGIGLLAVPVLAGSAAYAVGEAMGWTTGLDRLPQDARAFYAVIAAATLAGTAINFLGIDPIRALFWSAVLNGVVSVPLMVVIMAMAMRADVMGGFTLPRLLWGMGWLCTAVMGVAVAAMFWAMFWG